jgi:hypothetical protein
MSKRNTANPWLGETNLHRYDKAKFAQLYAKCAVVEADFAPQRWWLRLQFASTWAKFLYGVNEQLT